jgi:hypothetical protein
MSTATYLALMEAIQAHVSDELGEDLYAPHWVITCGIDTVDDYSRVDTAIQIYRSPRTPVYAVTGLLDWALQSYTPQDFD